MRCAAVTARQSPRKFSSARASTGTGTPRAFPAAMAPRLHRRADGEIGVGNHFHLASASLFKSAGPLTAIHASFICGNPQSFERPLSVKVSVCSVRQNFFLAAVVRKIQKHFVGN